jgi:hypothetical protein
MATPDLPPRRLQPEATAPIYSPSQVQAARQGARAWRLPPGRDSRGSRSPGRRRGQMPPFRRLARGAVPTAEDVERVTCQYLADGRQLMPDASKQERPPVAD